MLAVVGAAATIGGIAISRERRQLVASIELQAVVLARSVAARLPGR